MFTIYLSKREITLVRSVLISWKKVEFRITCNYLGQIIIIEIVSMNKIFSHLLDCLREVLLFLNNSALRSLVN